MKAVFRPNFRRSQGLDLFRFTKPHSSIISSKHTEYGYTNRATYPAMEEDWLDLCIAKELAGLGAIFDNQGGNQSQYRVQEIRCRYCTIFVNSTDSVQQRTT